MSGALTGVSPDGSQIRYLMDMNLRWIVTEAIHSINNALGSVQYAIYDLQCEVNSEEATDRIESSVSETASSLRAVYDLVNPIRIQQSQWLVEDCCERVASLLRRKLDSKQTEFSVDLPEEWNLPVSRAVALCQFLYTFMWLRINQCESLEYIKIESRKQDGDKGIIVKDPQPVDDILGMLEKERKNDLTGLSKLDRKEFAAECLRQFQFHLYNAEHSVLVSEGNLFISLIMLDKLED